MHHQVHTTIVCTMSHSRIIIFAVSQFCHFQINIGFVNKIAQFCLDCVPSYFPRRKNNNEICKLQVIFDYLLIINE